MTSLFEILKVKAMGAGAADDMFTALLASGNNHCVWEYLQDKEEYILQDSEEYDLVV